MTRPPGRAWLLSGVAVVAGGALGLGFPPVNWWWLVPVAVAVFVAVARLSTWRVGLLRGYLFGLGFNAVAFRWTAVLGVPVLAVFVVWLAVWSGLVGLVIGLTRRTPVWGAAGVATWLAGEWLGARWPFGGFGWGRLAYTAAGTPIDGLFPWLGVTGVSAVIVTTGFLLAWVAAPVLAGERGRAALRVVPVAATAAVLVLSGAGGWALRAYDPAPTGRPVTVAVVQGNVPGAGIDALGPIYTVENNHLAETILLAAQIRTGQAAQPDFVAWPENSTATDPLRDGHTQTIIELALDLTGVPILVGSITLGPGEDERQTTGLWWTPDAGVTAMYHKRDLVPFGEWVPFRSVLVNLVPALQYVGPQSVPGTTPGVLPVEAGGGPLRVGDIICFELAYDDTFDEMVVGDTTTGGGAEVIVVQTSNAMFTGSVQMSQQDRITRIRAMESRREILIATTNSLAGLVDSHGRVVYLAQLRTADHQVFTVPTRTTVTWAVAYRGWIDGLSIGVPLLGGLGFWLARHRRHGRAGPAVA